MVKDLLDLLGQRERGRAAGEVLVDWGMRNWAMVWMRGKDGQRTRDDVASS